MFERLLDWLLARKPQERIEAEEAYEKEFGRLPPRSFSTSYLNRAVERRQQPQAVRRVNSGHGVRSAQNDLKKGE